MANTRNLLKEHLTRMIQDMRDDEELEEACKQLVTNEKPFNILLDDFKRGFYRLVDRETSLESPFDVDEFKDEAEIRRLCQSFVEVCAKRRKLIERMSRTSDPETDESDIESEIGFGEMSKFGSGMSQGLSESESDESEID